MTPAEEHYVHFFECIESLNSAWRILTELGSMPDGAIRAAAYRMALVEYAKPYKRSNGAYKRGSHGYALRVPALPTGDLELHAQILALRDQVLAHSDLTLKDAIVYESRFNGHPFVAIGTNSIPSFPPVVSVIALIERTLDLMYSELRQLARAMKSLEGFQSMNGRAFYRPIGVVSAGEAVDLITDAVHRARSDGLAAVLISTVNLTGFEVPGPAFRRWAVRRFAAAGAESVSVVLVARPKLICPKKTGLLIAAEEGLHAHICQSEAEALAWLDDAAPQLPG